MNEDYYHEQNSCYDYNSFGFDQFQPPQYTVNHPIFNAQNELLNSQNEFLNSTNKLMEQMTTLCDMVGHAIQKKEEEKRIAEEQAAEDHYWKIPICYDDDDDYTIAITPVSPTKEPDNSLSMGDEHLDTIPATESDEVIKSSVENLVPIPSESEGIPDKMCDVPLCANTTPLNALNEHSEIVVNSYDDNSSSDDDSYENIDYVDASPPDDEIVSLEVVEIVDPEVGRIDDDILLTIKDDILQKKSSGSTTTHADFSQYDSFIFDLSINLFPPADRSDFYHEEFADELAHIISLSEYDHFCFKIKPELGICIMGCGGGYFSQQRTRVHVHNVLSTPPRMDTVSLLLSEPLFVYIVWIFLPFLTYPVAPPYLLSCGNEDIIFDPLCVCSFIIVYARMSWIFEVSRAIGPGSQVLLNPQLQFFPIPNLIELTVYL
ncbi:hypothetical protein Tco_0292345 [Tanacetum coccineum]